MIGRKGTQVLLKATERHSKYNKLFLKPGLDNGLKCVYKAVLPLYIVSDATETCFMKGVL